MKARPNSSSWLDKESRRFLGQHFQQARRAAGIRQSEVAEKIGRMTPQFISKFERGECLLPMPKLIAYSRVIRIRKEQLFDMLLQEQRKSLERIFR